MNDHAMHPSEQVELPIAAWRERILASVARNQVTIITAETGAGKSTQVPQFLSDAGYDKVVVTQPRIIAARNLCARVRVEYDARYGDGAHEAVGYRTSVERDDDPLNKILYCTDGLQLVRELTGSGTAAKQILVLDEVHEWNENMEVLVAWARKRCNEDPTFRIVLMSATIEAQDLATYFNANEPIAVSGRTFPVAQYYSRNLVDEVVAQLEHEPKNILVFLPGKSEIDLVAAMLQHRKTGGVPIIPLHGQLEAAAQQRAFAHYDGGKIILTTNVAQTSITIEDIDTVVDSGLERRMEVRSGVEGLFVSEISQADCMQRAGRAGRTKPGIYILAGLDRLPCSPVDARPAFATPEIMRKHLDRVVLRLAAIGIDIEELEFFHAPQSKAVKRAKRTLISLGALSRTAQITEIGRQMERFPVASSYARMLVEASSYAPEVQMKLVMVIAIQEVGGIVKGSQRFSGWRRFTTQSRSDLLAQYDVYNRLEQIHSSDYDELGIIAKNVVKATEVMERLSRDLSLTGVLPSITDDDDVAVMHCIVAGQMDQIWILEPSGEASHILTKKRRELSKGSAVRNAKLVSGTPFDLEVPTPRGLETLNLLNDVTAVHPEWMEEFAPQLYKVGRGKVYFEPYYGTLAVKTPLTVQNRTFHVSSTPLLERSEENKRQFVRYYGEYIYEQVRQEHRALELYHRRQIPDVHRHEIEARISGIAPGAISLIELTRQQQLELASLSSIATFLGEEYKVEKKITPERAVKRNTKRKNTFKPPHKRRRS